MVVDTQGLQAELGKLVQESIRREVTDVPDALPHAGGPIVSDDPFGRVESSAVIRARHTSMTRIGAFGCLRARPVGQQTINSPETFVVMGHRFLEMEPCAGIDVPMLWRAGCQHPPSGHVP